MSTTDALPHPGGLAAIGERTVARIGLGTMHLEHGDDDSVIALLRRAVDLGIDHLDAAQFYGSGRANARIRAALHPYPDHLTVITKVGATSDPTGQHGLRPAQTLPEIRTEVESNLRTLGLDHLDAVYIYPMYATPGVPADQIVDYDDQLAELITLRDAGTIGGIGLSHVDADQLRHALPAGIVAVQNSYNYLDRSSEPVFELCREHGIAWAPYFPMGSSFPELSNVADHPTVNEVAQRLGATPFQIGLAWLLTRGPQTLLIPGTRNIDHLAENTAAGDVVLDDEALALLNG